MAIVIVAVSAVGIIGCWLAARDRTAWVAAALLAGAAVAWLAIEGAVSGSNAHNPGQLSRGEWVAAWRGAQWLLWLGLLVASQVLLVAHVRRGHRTAPQ